MGRNILIAVLAAFVVAWLITRPPSKEQEAQAMARNAVALCWEEFKKMPASDDLKPHYGGVCTKKQNDYVRQYGRKP